MGQKFFSTLRVMRRMSSQVQLDTTHTIHGLYCIYANHLSPPPLLCLDIVMVNLESVVIPRIISTIETCLKQGKENHQKKEMTCIYNQQLGHSHLERVFFLGIDIVSENLLAKKMQLLKNKSQSYFDIPVDMQSATNWSQAVLELSSIEVVRTPNEKLAALLASAKAIYSSHNAEKKKLLKNGKWTKTH